MSLLPTETRANPSVTSLPGPPQTQPGEITVMLSRLPNRDSGCRDELIRMVYVELHRLAHHFLRGERQGHTLQPTMLVHDAFLRLTGAPIAWQNRKQFFATAGLVMRRVLVDHSRHRIAGKRGGTAARMVPIQEARDCTDTDSAMLLELDEALGRLSAMDPRQGRIVELRFFAGLSVEETAEVLEVSPTTVKREWHLARAWLFDQLRGGLL